MNLYNLRSASVILKYQVQGVPKKMSIGYWNFSKTYT